jgi:acetyl esterase/lipase
MKIDWSDQTSAVARIRMQTEVADEMDELDPLVRENYKKMPARDGHQIQLRIFKSNQHSTRPAPPLVVMWHGGGWTIGSPTMVAEIARSIVKRFGVVVVAPNYRLSPEHPWPIFFNDCADSLDWLRKNAADVGADPSRGFVIGGVSAGGHMALALAHVARDEKSEPKITGVWSNCGSIRPLDPSLLEEKYHERFLSRTQPECLNNPVLSPEIIDLMYRCAKPDMQSKLWAPLLWPSGDGHKGLPKVYQQLCGRDANRDEGLIFDDILKKEGVPSRVDLYPGLPHCFWLAFQHVPEYEQWKRDTLDGFQWLLDP